jgi:hypothetical protein
VTGQDLGQQVLCQLQVRLSMLARNIRLLKGIGQYHCLMDLSPFFWLNRRLVERCQALGASGDSALPGDDNQATMRGAALPGSDA